MNINKKTIIPIFLLILILIPLVSGVIITIATGNWTVATENELQATATENLAITKYNYTLNGATNFTQYLNFTNFDVNPNGFLGASGNMHFYMKMGIQDNTGNISYIGTFLIDSYVSWFGVIKQKYATYYPNETFGYGIENTINPQFNIGYGTTNFSITLFYVQNGNTLTTYAQCYDQNYAKVGLVEVPFSGYLTYYQDFELTSTDLEYVIVYFGCKGSGSFTAKLTEENLQEQHYGYTPEKAKDFVDMLPEPLKSIIMYIYTALGIIFVIFQLLITGITFIIPWLPYIAILYIVDVVYTSFEQKSFQPFGNMVIMVYEKTLLIITVIVEIGKFIWSFGASIIGILGSVFGLILI